MGRRKKEPRGAHREHIAQAAQELFARRGIAATTMDDIANAAGYSKATLYVYFKNKEEIVSVLVLESMRRLDDSLSDALAKREGTKERYGLICEGLARYQEEFPFYFKMALDKINVDFADGGFAPEDAEAYRVGEEINEKLKSFLAEGIERGELRDDLQVMPTIYAFWGMLSGFIQLASNKEDYLESALGLPRQRFLDYGFQLLYDSIAEGAKR
ncbi:TetR/AcrR family transcriptional regulator [Arabiibacter massiliensis]|uniref:TetR/AcrR family transcriptional regulator n=1 Tax=Arabiibacter massiliensis TaxID=1870985 RepID=UPI0009BB55F5|nr:TetR/AcrR family transcriptional regulator [Arabiibacter massiliensis]